MSVKINFDQLLFRLYSLFIIIYNVQSIIGLNGSLISFLSLGGIIFVGLYSLLMTFIKRNIKPFFGIFLLFVIIILFNLLRVNQYIYSFPELSVNPLWKHPLLLFFFCISFYYFSLTINIVDEFLFQLLPFIFVIYGIWNFYHGGNRNVFENEEMFTFVNNGGYTFLALIPFLLFIRNKIYKVTIFIICSYFILFSMKRGTILLYLVVILYLTYSFIKQKKGFLKKIFISITSIIIFVFFISAFFENNEMIYDRMVAMIHGHTSGRDILYHDIWNYFINESNTINFLFGGGLAYSLSITGDKFAHNDWFEILSDFGLFGVMIYLLMFVSVFYEFIYIKKINLDLSKIIFIFLLIYFGMTIFSMGFSSYDNVPLFIALGCSLSNKIVFEHKNNLGNE